MKLQSISKRMQGIVVLTVGSFVALMLWIWQAPYVECFVNEESCVYYVERNSDFFAADFLYALLMFGLGVLCALLFQRTWWQAGLLFQLGLAAYAVLLSIFVALAGQLVRPLTMINELRADAGIELRTLGAIFILPAIIQVIITVSGTAYGSNPKQDKSVE